MKKKIEFQLRRKFLIELQLFDKALKTIQCFSDDKIINLKCKSSEELKKKGIITKNEDLTLLKINEEGEDELEGEENNLKELGLKSKSIIAINIDKFSMKIKIFYENKKMSENYDSEMLIEKIKDKAKKFFKLKEDNYELFMNEQQTLDGQKNIGEYIKVKF